MQTPVMMPSPHLTSTAMRDAKRGRDDSYMGVYNMPHDQQQQHQHPQHHQQTPQHHQTPMDYKYVALSERCQYAAQRDSDHSNVLNLNICFVPSMGHYLCGKVEL